MELRGLGVIRRRIRIGYEREYCYVGIRLKQLSLLVVLHLRGVHW